VQRDPRTAAGGKRRHRRRDRARRDAHDPRARAAVEEELRDLIARLAVRIDRAEVALEIVIPKIWTARVSSSSPKKAMNAPIDEETAAIGRTEGGISVT
jgi:hypothetical protein